MKRTITALAGGTALIGALLLAPGAAHAADRPTPEDLTAAQKEAIAIWEAPQKMTGSSLTSVSELRTSRTDDAPTTRTSLYRGSFLMWANERVDFGSTDSSVSWSSGFQESGAVFPNNVTQNGTSRILSTRGKHTWRGSYTVGAGVPTPWGNANVYDASATATTEVRAGGAWSASWG
ncbi:hypothetical protein [Rathayibacter sp. VKM Ac-2760]|uniref:hypothetical protein n=1 Tax=Rathayibacter sp. VKM Ac-2760 TaxID=2609253 RepID=UPI001319AC97|nr:hypothetical protein [Rathayibacter sp. VKM Ac-2760]QHC57585.1 hypothetical protein GSU72_02525 [Rathayibacter sp. VKM Ac-2760]